MECEKIKLSVIMLAYNHAPYVREAIESVLCQHTDFAFEILIGDDASTDNTPDIIREYAERYPKQIIPVLREENLGATQNLYDLIEHSHGQYLAYLECDDCWCDTGKLQRQVNFLDQHPAYIACTHQIVTIDEDGKPYEEKLDWICDKEEYTLADFKGIVLPGHISSMVHRNIFMDSHGQYKELITLHPLISDRTLCLLLASMGPIRQFSHAMSCYRQPTLKRGSATAVLFVGNPQKTVDDYLFTKKLEEYTVQHLGCPVDFDPQKKRLLFDAVWTALRHPRKSTLSIAARMLRFEHSPDDIMYIIKQIKQKITVKFRKEC